MKNGLFYGAVASTLILVSTTASSQNIGFLEYDPTRFFTDEDWRISDESYLKALEKAADGETYKWRNDASGAQGTETPLKTFISKRGNRCRQMKSTLDTTNPVASVQFTFVWCKQPNGEWKQAKKTMGERAE